MEQNHKRRVSDLYFYVRDTMEYINETLATSNLEETERTILLYQLDVLKKIKAICEKRNRY